ncbi:hypothetical protein TRAPUB_14029 [Trametes pubescens]|uniref:Uncharacterized protein n=1 Tax=Trametes pubescens TaxID=154538 RepID=A0A1M2VPH0_TRAPU|nr:hypothetical protein TRAPUB_14029 [Trametes pubescens]
MPAPLDRESLKSMKRADLQRICKDYGIKANLKTEALIDLLIDTTTARPRPTPPMPQRAPSGRRVSRAVPPVSRPRGTSSSSVIIHDSDEEDQAFEEQHRRSVAPTISSEPEAPHPPPRTRRAKDTQYRLGVGRPTVVGGSGARAVTRSSSSTTKGKRGKASRSVKPVEAAIQEEEEPEPMEYELPQAGPSGTVHDHEPPLPAMPTPQEDPVPSPDSRPDIPDQVRAYINELVTPFQAQIQLLQSELQQRSNREADILALTSQLQSVQAEVQSLRSQATMASQLQIEVQQLKQLVSELMRRSTTDASQPSAKSSGKARASDDGSSQASATARDPTHNAANPLAQQVEAPHGGSQPLLGKRHRDSDDSDSTDAVEAGQEGRYSQEELKKKAVRPTKKRLKLAAGAQDEERHGSNAADQGSSQLPDPLLPPSRPTFTVFSGPEEPVETYIDPPPPTDHLSDLFPLPTITGGQTAVPTNNGGGTIVRPIGADENAPNFGFNFSFNTSIFQPMTSTPFDMGHPSFAYPEPPASPTPGGVPSGGFVERAGGRIERNDLYHPHGRRHAQSQAQVDGESPSRPQSATSRPASRASYPQAASQPQPSASGVGTVNPTALVGTPNLPPLPEVTQEESNTSMSNGIASFTRRIASSSEIGIALGMSSTLPLPPDTPVPPMKRTMYGTELEGDTRFGDFGVEGVATGFWAGMAPRF